MKQVQKPPLGLIPEKYYDRAVNIQRIADIIDAIERTASESCSSCPHICDWLPELRRRIDKINSVHEWR